MAERSSQAANQRSVRYGTWLDVPSLKWGVLVAGALLSVWAQGACAEPSNEPVPDDVAFAEGDARAGPVLLGGAHNSPNEALVFRVEGPNDGEPLERGRLPLWFLTNYAQRGEIRVHIEGITAGILTYLPPHELGKTGTLRLPHSLDLVAIGKQLGTDLLAPDYGPLRVTTSLRDSSRRVITQTSWASFIGHPWLEFDVIDPIAEELEDDPLANYWNLVEELAKDGPAYDFDDDPLFEFWDLFEILEERRLQLIRDAAAAPPPDPALVPEGSIGVVPHFRPSDVYYFLATSTNAEAVHLPPDHPAFLMANGILSSGPVVGPDQGLPIFFEDWYRTAHRVRYELVLWAFDREAGEWQRSLIHHSRP